MCLLFDVCSLYPRALQRCLFVSLTSESFTTFPVIMTLEIPYWSTNFCLQQISRYMKADEVANPSRGLFEYAIPYPLAIDLRATIDHCFHSLPVRVSRIMNPPLEAKQTIILMHSLFTPVHQAIGRLSATPFRPKFRSTSSKCCSFLLSFQEEMVDTIGINMVV